MPDIASAYERGRDIVHLPSCWRAVDNCCTPHFHSALELAYLQDGEMDALVDGSEVTVRKRELLIVPPYSMHRYVTRVASDNLVLTIPQDYIPSFQQLTSGKKFSEILLPAGKATNTVAHAMRLLLKQPESEVLPVPINNSYITRGQVYTILGTLLENIPLRDVAPHEGHALTQDILRYLDNHYRNTLTLQELATSFGYSRSSISRSFNMEVGCSIPEYVGALRSRAAAVMLMDGKASITHIAMEAGFESMRTFYRAFKSCFGITPSQFAKLSHADLQQLVQNNSLCLVES